MTPPTKARPQNPISQGTTPPHRARTLPGDTGGSDGGLRFARLQGWRVGFVRPLGGSADPTLSHLGHHPFPPHPPTQASLLATSLPRPPPPCRAEAVVPSPPSWPTQESSGRGPGAKADPGALVCLPDLQSCHLTCAGLSPGYPIFCCPKSL